jgi:hypothetical protein
MSRPHRLIRIPLEGSPVHQTDRAFSIEWLEIWFPLSQIEGEIGIENGRVVFWCAEWFIEQHCIEHFEDENFLPKIF